MIKEKFYPTLKSSIWDFVFLDIPYNDLSTHFSYALYFFPVDQRWSTPKLLPKKMLHLSCGYCQAFYLSELAWNMPIQRWFYHDLHKICLIYLSLTLLSLVKNKTKQKTIYVSVTNTCLADLRQVKMKLPFSLWLALDNVIETNYHRLDGPRCIQKMWRVINNSFQVPFLVGTSVNSMYLLAHLLCLPKARIISRLLISLPDPHVKAELSTQLSRGTCLMQIPFWK